MRVVLPSQATFSLVEGVRCWRWSRSASLDSGQVVDVITLILDRLVDVITTVLEVLEVAHRLQKRLDSLDRSLNCSVESVNFLVLGNDRFLGD